jgi:predicted SnoaL-like aldol condensation-catalyzing enzyme
VRSRTGRTSCRPAGSASPGKRWPPGWSTRSCCTSCRGWRAIATTELFGHRDLSAIDRAWAADYVEHSTLAGPGLDGLRAAASSLPAGFRHERLRVLGEDELVVVHGLYHGLGPVPIVGCDLWRVADDRIAEHWDARQPWVDQPVSGHTMTDGPATVAELDKTATSKKLVEQFVELIMMGGDRT